MVYHCLFEQSGTFKNEFKKLGYLSFDYDILNDFNQTDFVIDLFNEINNAYIGSQSIFDNFSSDNDFLIAFFPCIRFENQAYMMFQGTQRQLKNKSLDFKLEYDLKLHSELHDLYSIITKLVLVCLRKKLKLIIENPYSATHYLTRYWALKPSVIDMNRSLKGDFYVKPTQYYFINCEPKNNLIFDSIILCEKSYIHLTSDKVKRSLISKEYANRFIREYII